MLNSRKVWSNKGPVSLSSSGQKQPEFLREKQLFNAASNADEASTNSTLLSPMAITCMLRSEIAKRMSTGKLFGITYWNCPWSIILSGNYNMYLNSLEFGKIIHSTVMSTLDIENRKSQGGRFITGKFRNVIVVLEISCVDYTFLHYTVMWHVFFYTSVPSTIVSGPLDPPLLTTGDTILRLWHQVCYIIT